MTLLVLVYSDFEGALVALHNEWCLFTQTLGCAVIALRNEWCLSSNKRVCESSIYYSALMSLLRMSTSESRIPRPCF